MRNDLRQYLTGFLYLASVCCAVLGQSSAAHAWFKVCNKSTKGIYYHHSISDSSCGSGGIREKGWWFVAAGGCATVSSASMNSRYFDYYAESSDRSLVWSGSGLMYPVPDAAFDRCGALACNVCPPPPPGSRNLTHRAKTGTATDYTLNLWP